MYELKLKDLYICIINNKGKNEHLNLEFLKKELQNKTKDRRS